MAGIEGVGYIETMTPILNDIRTVIKMTAGWVQQVMCKPFFYITNMYELRELQKVITKLRIVEREYS